MSYNPLISVIVPVYNVETYLNRCINSILNQSYDNIEIILVDDGSSDNSSTLCDILSNNYPAISVIHKVNGGLSSARNAGLQIAKGDYIGFVDSDDWIHPEMYQYLFNLIINNNADIAEGDIYLTEKEIYSIKSKPYTTVLNNNDIIYDYFYIGLKTGNYSVCNKLYKKQTIGNIRFIEGKINEDIFFNYQVLTNANRLVKYSAYFYFYFQGYGSITTRGLNITDFDLIKISKEIMCLTQNNYSKKIHYLCKVKYARAFFSLLCKIAYYGISDDSINRKECIKYLTNNLRSNILFLLFGPLPISRKIMALALFININCIEIPLKLYKKYE